MSGSILPLLGSLRVWLHLSKMTGFPPLDLCRSLNGKCMSSGVSNGTTSPFSLLCQQYCHLTGADWWRQNFFHDYSVLAAVAACHTGFRDKTASQHPLVCRFMRGVCRHLPVFRPLTPPWALGVFLEGFKGLPIWAIAWSESQTSIS